MNKDFLTLKDAANRLGSPSSTNMNFIHKDGAILSGADPTPLSSYSLYDFPADDDIIKILSQIFLYVGGIQEGNIDYNNPRMVIEYLTIDA